MPTKLLAKIVGLWLVLTVLGMMLARQTTLATMNALFADAPLMWITGVFTMLVGIVVVVVHNRWTEGALAAIVTFYGWAALVKGALFLWLPPSSQTSLYLAMHLDQFYYVYLCIALVLGGYLVYGGFKSERPA